VFGDLYATTAAFDTFGNANSQSPEGTVGSQIVDPANFPSAHKLNPPLTFVGSPNPVSGGPPGPAACIPDSETGICPAANGGDPGAPGGAGPGAD
jgi:hypothetical protein